MASLNGFNAEEVEPAAKFDPIPAGRYQAIITDSEQKPTKAGTGHYLQLTFQIQEGTYKGRILWPCRLLVRNCRQSVGLSE